MRSLLGPVALLALLGTFLLPFSTSTVMGVKVVQSTGYDTGFGRKALELPIGEWFGGGKKSRGENEQPFSIRIETDKRDGGNRIVAAAFTVGILGGLIGFAIPSLGALGGIGSAVLFLVAQADMQKQFQQVPLASLTFEIGFWASLGCAAVGGVICLLRGRS